MAEPAVAKAYDAAVAACRADPGAYWLDAATAIAWSRPPRIGFTTRADGMANWFPDGQLNITASALDRHVAAGRGAQPAILWESPASGERGRLSYAALLEAVARCAGGLRRLGVQAGDRVMICMPPVPETIIAMLACARLGAIHVVAFAGFAGPELASRIDDVTPRLIVTASCCFTGRRPTPLLPAVAEALLRATHRPEGCILLTRPGLAASPLPLPVHDFAALVAQSPAIAAVDLPSGHPLYILHTSGTTGQPKGVVRDHGGTAVALHRSMHEVYGARPGSVFFCAADPGWVVGHSYGVYAPLLAGCTSVLYEGSATGTPDAGGLWRIAARHRAEILFAAPTAFRTMRAEDPGGAHGRAQDLARLRAVFVAGERCDRGLLGWIGQAAGCPAHDHWWQTETGSAIAGSLLGLGIRAASGIGRATPGADLVVLDEEGRAQPAGMEGELALRLPMPPGCLSRLWGDGDRLEAIYLSRFPGFYRTFDQGLIAADGEVTVTARLDDVIKVAGRRIAAGRIEEVLERHPAVLECAVTRRPDAVRGEVPVGFVVRRAGGMSDAALRAALILAVREEIGGLAGFRTIAFVPALPRTRSGKVLRRRLEDSLAQDEASPELA